MPDSNSKMDKTDIEIKLEQLFKECGKSRDELSKPCVEFKELFKSFCGIETSP